MSVELGQITEEFDVDAAISKFLEDPSSSALELPHMTTGQRKLTKKIADRNPDLICESYGFGQDRKLHLFKKGCRVETGNVANAVKVKNTFIDDWCGSENGAKSDSILFRSMPVALSEHALQECGSPDVHLLDLPCVTENSVKGEELWEATSLDRSTAASSSNSVINSPTGSMKGLMIKKPPGLPTPTGLEIRNTFIHFDCPPADERCVQSMPHGMFSQCLYAETLRAKVAEQARCVPTVQPPCPAPQHAPVFPAPQHAPVLPPPVTSVVSAPVTCPPPAVAPTDESLLETGTEVVTDGLLKCPAFNGLSGTVQSYNAETGRYDVLLTPNPGGHKWAKVKRDNLILAAPAPPPDFFPTLAR